MRGVVATVDTHGGAVAQRALDAALQLIGEMNDDVAASRAGAITLLAADALMTYAFEAAGEDGARIDPLAAEAMTRIASSAVASA